MPIVATDLKMRYTIKTGAAGNSVAQGNPANSLGKYISATPWTGALHDLFPRLDGEDNMNAVARYRAIGVANLHATLTLLGAAVFLPDGDPAGGAAIAIGVDPTPASLLGAAAAQGLEIPNDTTAPAGVVFTTPTTYASGIPLGDIPPLSARFFWVRRAGANSAAVPAESVRFRLRGGTLA